MKWKFIELFKKINNIFLFAIDKLEKSMFGMFEIAVALNKDTYYTTITCNEA